MEILLIAVITVLSFLIIMYRMDIEKFLGYDIAVDILTTILITILFAGTYSGMMVAVVGGLIMSISLKYLRWWRGYKLLVGGKWVKHYKGAPR